MLPMNRNSATTNGRHNHIASLRYLGTSSLMGMHQTLLTIPHDGTVRDLKFASPWPWICNWLTVFSSPDDHCRLVEMSLSTCGDKSTVTDTHGTFWYFTCPIFGNKRLLKMRCRMGPTDELCSAHWKARGLITIWFSPKIIEWEKRPLSKELLADHCTNRNTFVLSAHRFVSTN